MARKGSQSKDRRQKGGDAGLQLVVGIGASAGGLDAIRGLFRGMPLGIGCSFVVAQHLDATRRSMMAELVGRETALTVVEATDGLPLQPDTVAIVPPGHLILVEGNEIRLPPLDRARVPPVTVDRLFQSIAAAWGDRGVGIILSGSGSDGTSGLRSLVEVGGLAIAQDPETAEHRGMPSSAIDAKTADLVLPVADMPSMLAHYLAAGRRPPVAELLARDEASAQCVEEAIDLISHYSRNDFRQYKRLTLLRRLDRRMNLRHIERLQDYVDLLKKDETELAAMAHDLLISVTCFFRNREAYDRMRYEVAPAMIRAGSADDPVRLWICGCATGEEAYTFAMIFHEALEAAGSPRRLQIFASDIDTAALAIARDGRYPANVAIDVEPARLTRFFVQGEQTYRIIKPIRDSIIFGEHNILSDPPFSQMDLISCQNVLIYIDSVAQERIMPLFHYALRPGGFLMLGPSETASGAASALFREHAEGERIYRRIDEAKVPTHKLAVPYPRQFPWRAYLGRTAPASDPTEPAPPPVGMVATALEAAVLINDDYEIQYFHGNTGPFLSPPAGVPSANLLTMAREGLGLHIRGLVHEARETRRRSLRPSVPMSGDGVPQSVRLTASWCGTDPPLCVVTFEELPDEPAQDMAADATLPALRALERELEATRHDLKSTIAELENSNESLRASHEEILAANEEMQSSNAELETSKEELQALNEELNTVNMELESKISEMREITADLENLINNTDMPILYLDETLNIRRYTPATKNLFNFRLGDIGRPITDFSLRTENADLDKIAATVLREEDPHESIVLLRDGRSLKQRVTPYRMAEDKVSGVVAAYSDVTDLVRAREDEAQQRGLIGAVLEQAADGIVVTDAAGRAILVNEAAVAMSEQGAAATQDRPPVVTTGLHWGRTVDSNGKPITLERHVSELASKGATIRNLRYHLVQSGRVLDIEASGSPVYDNDGKLIATVSMFRDISGELADQVRLAESEARYRSLLDCIPHGIFLKSREGRYAMMNPAVAEMFGTAWPTAAALTDRDLFPTELADLRERSDRAVTRSGERVDRDVLLPNGRTVHMVNGPYRDAAGEIRGVFGIVWDVTGERQREDDVKAARTAAETASAAKSSFLRGMSHDLRSPLNAIIGFAEALLTGIYGPIESDRQRESLESILQSGSYLLGIINQVLDIARMEAGALVLDRLPVNVPATIAKAAQIAIAGLAPPLAPVRFDLPDTLPAVDADDIRFAEVIVNLLSNALKWTPADGEVRVAAAATENGMLRLTVADTGAGMTPQQVEEAFEPFRTGNRDIMVTTEGRGGSSFGLGLVVVKQIVDLHGAVIALESRHGKGTEVTLDWPLANGSAAGRAPTPLSAAAASASPGAGEARSA